MTMPSATYRLQLRGGMTFAGAAELAPYLRELGISHVYLSPIFRAVPGSTHGYDAADFNEIEPELGGTSGFAHLIAKLHQNGLKAIVDFVPNHMGASPTNPWWRAVLEWGQLSAYAHHFDVDWNAPKLIIPALVKPYGEVLLAGELSLRFDAGRGAILARYFDLELPLTPPSYATVLASAEEEDFSELARRFAAASPETSNGLRTDFARATADRHTRNSVEDACARLQADRSALHDLLEAQVWRLTHWRASRESLTYRRFFEISDLVGVRVEQPGVFDDVHRTILALVAEGQVEGLRIDHVDGVADPLDYLTRLREAAGPETYIVVEKILGENENLRPAWPVAGTTGYEFIRDISDIFVADCEPALSRAYAGFARRETDFAAETIAVKRRTLTRNLAGELDVLTGQALELARVDINTRDFGSDTLRRAIIELAANFPVYRTYVNTAGADAADVAVLGIAADGAKASREVDDDAAIDLIVRYLTLDLEGPERQVAALAFAKRFQQTTGPLMAKALEDTLFYRSNRLIALNEVGGEPARPSAGPLAFHRAMAARRETSQSTLTATATHDTKRGEDARARIYAISEIPEIWSRSVERWSAQLQHARGEVNGERVPEPEMEWLFYQSLVGVWPPDLDLTDVAGLASIRLRMVAFMQKAAREAKLHTSWTQPDEAYERGLENFVTLALASGTSQVFLADFLEVARPLMQAGAITSLTQVVIKIFAPGVPDVYQGTELWDLALVDPDNRLQVDFGARQKALAVSRDSTKPSPAAWQSGEIKLGCLHAVLALRARLGEAFLAADYVPLRAVGPLADHVVAFARTVEDHVVVVVGARLALALLDSATFPSIAASRWQGTVVSIPPRLQRRDMENILTRQTISVGEDIDLAVLLADLPVAVLSTCISDAQPARSA